MYFKAVCVFVWRGNKREPQIYEAVNYNLLLLVIRHMTKNCLTSYHGSDVENVLELYLLVYTVIQVTKGAASENLNILVYVDYTL